MAHWDAIVVGVGGVGSAALYHLAERGHRVLGIDRFAPPHDRGSSHGQTRIIRQAYFEHPDYVPLAVASYELWEVLQAMVRSTLFHQTGLVEVGPADGVVVPGVLRAARQHSLAVSEMSAGEVSRRWPGLTVPEGLCAVFEPNAGYLLVEACVEAHLQAARACGAKLQTDSPLVRWTSDAGTAVVETAGGRHTTDRLIITAGAWAGSLLSDLGVHLEVRRKVLLWYAVRDPEIYSAARGFPAHLFELPYGVPYGFPQLDGRGVKLSDHSGGDPVEDPLEVKRELQPADRAPIERFITEHMPFVTPELTDWTVCLYTMSPDEHFILDRHPRHANVWFCAGLSGHGFKFTPVLGRALADLATDGGTELPVGFLGLRRLS